MFSTITGHLVAVSMDGEEPTPDGFEGTIQVQSELPKESTLYRIGVPTGLMDTVMPALWGLRVNVLVGGQNEYPFYTLCEIDEADNEDEEGWKAGYDRPDDTQPEEPAQHVLGQPDPEEAEPDTTQHVLDALTQALTTNLYDERERRVPENGPMIRVLWSFPIVRKGKGDVALLREIDGKRWIQSENPMLLERPDSPELADYRITRLNKTTYLAEMHAATKDHTDMAIRIEPVATAAMIVKDPHGGGRPEQDPRAKLQQLADHLGRLMDEQSKDNGRILVLWDSGWGKESRPEGYIAEILRKGACSHRDDDHFNSSLPDIRQQARSLRIRPGMWLTTFYNVVTDLEKRKLVQGTEPAGQLLMRVPVEQAP